MIPHGSRAGGFFRNARLTTAALVLVTLLTVVGFAVAPAASAAWGASGGTPAPPAVVHSAVHPAAGTPPTIYEFSAFPSEFSLGQSSELFVSSSSQGIPSYSYTGLPPGCFSSDSEFLFCTPSAGGAYTVTVAVTDTLTLGVSTAQAHLYVDPIVNGSFYTVQPNVLPTFSVTFFESGLPFGTAWSVSMNGATVFSTSFSATFIELSGIYAYTFGSVAGYSPTPASGLVQVQDAPASVSVSFIQNTVVFSATGLATGEQWSVELGATQSYGTGTQISFGFANGFYSYTIGSVDGLTPSPASGSVFLTGTGATVPVTFTAPGPVVYNVTLTQSGLPLNTFWSVTLGGTVYGTTTSTLLVTEPNGSYSYTVNPVAGYTVAPALGTVVVAGADPTPVPLVYTLAPAYPVTFSESGLATGTTWGVTIDNQSLSSSTASIVADLTNGSYSFWVGSSVAGVPGYSVSPLSGTVNVAGGPVSAPAIAFSVAVEFQPGQAACQTAASPPFYTESCFPQANSPTLLTLGNGDLALTSQLGTTATPNGCPLASASTVARIGFQVSADGGQSFGPAASLGNDTCSYLNAIEPSFAASGSSVYGAFIEENSTLPTLNYTARGADALGFLSSNDNGTTFAPAMTLDAAGNLARPAIAAFGSTIYIVFENIQNSTTPIGGGALPISLEFIVSTDGGASWSSPTVLPGQGATQGYNAMSPAIAVSASGTLAVAYATDRACAITGLTGCLAYADHIVVVTSSNNGSLWQGPYTAASGAGESACFTGTCSNALFQATPQVALAWDPSGAYLYLAYAATYDQGLGATSLNFNHTGVFAAVSSNGGSTWSGGAVAAPSGSVAVRSFNPGLGVSNQGVFVTYLQANETPGQFGLANSLTQWVANSPVGSTLSWDPPTVADLQSYAAIGGSVNTTETSFPGYSSTVGFGPTGAPLVAFALPQTPVQTIARGVGYYYLNTTYATDLAVASPAVAGALGVVSENFTETGLPAGTPWRLYVDGVSYDLNVPSIIIMNLPASTPLVVGAYYTPGIWTLDSTYYNATETSFVANGTDTFPFLVWVGLELNIFPANLGYWYSNGELYISAVVDSTPFPAYVDAEWEMYETCFFPCTKLTPDNNIFYDSSVGYWSNNCVNAFCTWTEPWYFPLGSVISLTVEDYMYTGPPAVYFTGTGTTAYTGAVTEELICGYYFDGFCEYYYYVDASGDIYMNGPITQTLWLGDAPENLTSNLTVSAPSLPAGSTFHATFNGTVLNGTSAAPATVKDVAPGAYGITGIWASSTQPGWEYFGSVQGPNPFVLPLDTAVTLAFNAYVNVSAPAGQVMFNAPAVPEGTTWSLTFNGTTYTSSTPWINVTTRPGTFAYAAGNAVGADGTSGFTPTSPTGNVSVLPGDTYTINYVPAFELVVQAAAGGLISVTGGGQSTIAKDWVPSGRTVTLGENPTYGYAFESWNGTGSGSYSGSATAPQVTVNGPIVESASFLPLPSARFNLTFVASGLPAGAWWTVDLNGIGYSADTASLNVTGLYAWTQALNVGHYNLTVPTSYANGNDLTRYVVPPTAYPPLIGTNGTLTPPVVLPFTTENLVTLSATGDGVIESTYSNAPSGTSVWAAQGSQVTITATPYPGWTFSGWEGTGSGSYTGSAASQTLVANGPINEVAVFAPVAVAQTPTYSVNFYLQAPLATGTVWGVNIDGVGFSTTQSTLTVNNLTANTYAMQVMTAVAPEGTTQYRATSADPVAFTIRGPTNPAPIEVSYTPYYLVTVSTSLGGTVNVGTGWYEAGEVLYLVATANLSDNFVSWTGSGTGSYSGSNSTAALVITGPVTEVATFESSSPAAAGSSVWSSPATWAGIAGAAILAGVLLGVLFGRTGGRGGRPASGGTNAPRGPALPPPGGSG
jgi:hypothetical protein